jgi:hypothetical protein
MARPLISMPITTDRAPVTARMQIGDALYVARRTLHVESRVAVSTPGGRDTHALPTPDRR